MSARARILGVAAAAAAACLAVSGCGEKITIPKAEGLFSVTAYFDDGVFAGTVARDIAVANNILFVTHADSLTKRNHGFEVLEAATGLDAPTAVCADETDVMIFVWESGSSHLSAWSSRDLAPLGSVELPDVQSVTHLGAASAGLAAIAPGALTFVYLSDPDSSVVHRYAWYADGVAEPTGILCRSDGLSTRFVHEPAGLYADDEGMMFVCDADTMRNWVNRFDPSPDLNDVTADTLDVDPWRGIAILMGLATCNPPVEADYTLGDAPECGEDWTGGPSAAPGEFTAPTALTADGRGWFYVADRGNSRIQLLDADGIYQLEFGGPDRTPAPQGIVAIDQYVTGSGWHYGAFVFVVTGDAGGVRKFISYEHYQSINQEPPPPP